MKKRLLFLTNTLGFGGTEKHLTELILRLDLTIIDPVIICFGSDFYTVPLRQIHGLSVLCIHTNIKFGVFSFLTFLWTFITFKPDVIVFVKGNFEIFPWYAYLAAKIFYHAKIVSIEQLTAEVLPEGIKGTGFRNELRKILGWRARHVFKGRLLSMMNDMTICVSQATREKLVNQYRYPMEKTITIRNGIDLKHYSLLEGQKQSIRKDFGISADDIILLCVARLAPVKRIDVLLEAMPSILEEFPSCKCLIVGDGPLREKLALRCEELALTRSVSFVGFVSDVRPFLEMGDIFVLSSQNEGLPIAVVEAMAYGLPCIVTNVGGNNEAILDGYNGIVVAQESVKELEEAIKYLLGDKEERGQMGVNGKKRAHELFDNTKLMEMVKTVLLS